MTGQYLMLSTVQSIADDNSRSLLCQSTSFSAAEYNTLADTEM